MTIADVLGLGRALIETANLYPTRFLTERDFSPLVAAYLNGRVPSLKAEVAAKGGTIDFHLKGANPTWLELAVQPRALCDKNFPTLAFSGHRFKNNLYGSQNKAELRKLMHEPKGKTRFLLLVDLSVGYDTDRLRAGYQREASKLKKWKIGSRRLHCAGPRDGLPFYCTQVKRPDFSFTARCWGPDHDPSFF